MLASCFCCTVEEVAADLFHMPRRSTPLAFVDVDDDDGASINVVEQTLVYGLEI